MSEYTAGLSLPGIENSPTFRVVVHADSEDGAVDAAFEKAFRDYPQYGGFQIDSVEQP